MELIILGRNKDDKGKQLELLTKHLLSTLGYTDIVTNDIGAGGQEVDVRAEIRIPSLRGGNRERVICECKAHQTPIQVTDWFKFLGKLLVEEARLHAQVRGCFIALSGVNGNVAGSYDALRQNRPGIELITGDDLVNLITKAFNLIPVNAITARLNRVTDRALTKLSLCYYDKSVLWLADFAGKSFSLIHENGQSIGESEALELIEMLQEQLPYKEYLDLGKEALAAHRRAIAEKIVIAMLLIGGGEGDADSIIQAWKQFCPEPDGDRYLTVDLLN